MRKINVTEGVASKGAAWARLAAAGVAVACVLATPAFAQNDKMQPVHPDVMCVANYLRSDARRSIPSPHRSTIGRWW